MDPNTFFTKILPIQDEALRARVVSLSQVRKLDKGAFLVREGETMSQISFLLSGILLGFFLDYNGRDITDCFGVRCGALQLPAGRPLSHLHPGSDRHAGPEYPHGGGTGPAGA